VTLGYAAAANDGLAAGMIGLIAQHGRSVERQ
jgi:hypothetical protein